jgi:hypothetical protein
MFILALLTILNYGISQDHQQWSFIYPKEKKKNKIMSFAEKWMLLEMIILSEISQSYKSECHVSSC